MHTIEVDQPASGVAYRNADAASVQHKALLLGVSEAAIVQPSPAPRSDVLPAESLYDDPQGAIRGIFAGVLVSLAMWALVLSALIYWIG